MTDSKNLTQSLSELEKIVNWFDEQEEVDVEEGLTKVRVAASLIKDSKARLAEIENEFQTIEKEINDGEDFEKLETVDIKPENDDQPIDLSEIPF